MLGELVMKVLVLLLGYGYPAFESFKMLEEPAVEIRRLRFWCQYWTIVGVLTVFEWFGDICISWLPMYGEAKLALFIYLWHPKTMGTVMVYEAFLRPLVVTHEPDIELKLRHFRAKSADLLLFYIKNFTEKGQSFFLDMLHYTISRSPSSRSSSTKEDIKQAAPLPPHSITVRSSSHQTEAEGYDVSELMEFDPEVLQKDPRRPRGRWKKFF